METRAGRCQPAQAESNSPLDIAAGLLLVFGQFLVKVLLLLNSRFAVMHVHNMGMTGKKGGGKFSSPVIEHRLGGVPELAADLLHGLREVGALPRLQLLDKIPGSFRHGLPPKNRTPLRP